MNSSQQASLLTLPIPLPSKDSQGTHSLLSVVANGAYSRAKLRGMIASIARVGPLALFPRKSHVYLSDKTVRMNSRVWCMLSPVRHPLQ